MLLPFWPLRPHLFDEPPSSVASPLVPGLEAALLFRMDGLGPSCSRLGPPPPKMADTDECGDRAYFWRDDVTAIHSDMTREIGSTATETGRLLYCMRDMCPWNRRA